METSCNHHDLHPLFENCLLLSVVSSHSSFTDTKTLLIATPLLNFYSQADPYKFRHVDDYSLKLNFARTTKLKHSFFLTEFS